MHEFREALLFVLQRDVRIYRGEASIEAQRYRAECMKLYMSRGPKLRVRRAILHTWLRGDWQNHTFVEVYIGWQEPIDMPKIYKALSDEVMYALCPRVPTTYNRDRWDGAQEAVSDIGLMECCHGRFTKLYCTG